MLTLVAVTSLPGRQKQEKIAGEKTPEEASQKLFKALHCAQSNSDAIKAFEGCWKVGAVWGSAEEDSLKLGMRMSTKRSQLWLDSYDAQQANNSNNPRYCIAEGLPTVAPYPDTDFQRAYTYAYVMLDNPMELLEKYRVMQGNPEPEIWKGHKKTIEEFLAKGGKLIRTMIVQGPTHVWWDSDWEEDFWALPASCEGWKEVEALILEEAWTPPSKPTPVIPNH